MTSALYTELRTAWKTLLAYCGSSC